MHLTSKATLALLGLGATLTAPAFAQGVIQGGYTDGGGANVPQSGSDIAYITITNTGAAAFTNVTLSGTKYQDYTTTDTVALPDIAAGTTLASSSFDLPFSEAQYSYGNGNDVDEGELGNFSLLFSALQNGQAVTATFSPTTNASGGFVGFEGYDARGNASDGEFNVTTLATIPATVAPHGLPAVPEPSQFAGMGLGLFSLAGLMLRARRRKPVTV